MYSPKAYMTMDVLAQLLAEFDWPAPYLLDDDLPDGIIVAFPKCQLYISEGFESRMTMRFLDSSPGLPETVELHELLRSMGSPSTEGIDPTDPPAASLEKVQIGVRNLCKRVLTHCRATLLGDFSWYPAFAAYKATQRL
jgi:hypothetical protein